MTIGFDLRLRGVSGQVHPVIYGHPSPLAFLGWAQALVRDAWRAGFGVPPSVEEMPDALSEVSIIIGLVEMQIRGKRHYWTDAGDRTKMSANWRLPVRRAVERNNGKAFVTGIGDDPRLDGHWKLALELPSDLNKDANGPNKAPFLNWMNAWRLAHPLAGGFPEDGDSLPPKVMSEERLIKANGFFKGAWLMTPPAPGKPIENAATYVQQLNLSPYRTSHRMPTVLGYQLLEAPESQRLGARKGLRHAFADPILGTVTWGVAQSSLPRWVLDVRRDEYPYGLVLATAAGTTGTANIADDF